MFQMKEQDNIPEAELNEVEINNLPSKEFKVIKIIKMFNKLRRRMDEHSEKFNKELDNIKNQTELKSTRTEIKKYTRRNQQ